MNILQVIPAYVPAEDYGGAPAVSHEISKELINRGHDVTVYTTTVNNGDNQFSAGPDQIDGVDVYRFNLRSNWLASRASIFIPSGFNKKIRDTITEYDVAHVHDYRTPLTVETVRAAQGTDTSVVFQPHGAFIRTHRFVRMKKLFDSVLGEYLLSNIDCSLALNESQADAIKSLYTNAETKVVPNGVPTIPDREFASNEFRTAYGIDEEQLLVLYLGRLHDSKRIDLAVKAFKKLSSENAVLTIVGPDDGSRDKLESLVSSLSLDNQVLFTGRVSEEQKWQAFIDADLMVTPAFYGFPLTFLEAMAMRTPVLTTTYGQVIKDLEERGGILTDPTPDELAAEMDHVLSDREYQQRLRDQAYDSIQNYYTWPNIVDQLEEIYEEH